MMTWVNSGSVTKYLSDDSLAEEYLSGLYDNVPEYLYTYHFSRDGLFYMVCRGGHGDAVGFIHFRNTSEKQYEIVYVVGEEKLWGRGIGKLALSQALKEIFLIRRADRVIARIHPENVRSIRTAEKCGLAKENSEGKYLLYSVSKEDFLGRF